MKKIILLLIFISSTIINLQAQEDPSVVPRDAMAKLHGMLGKWSLTSFYYNQQDKVFVEQAQSNVSITPLLKGLGMREKRVSIEEGQTLGIDVTYGYDQYRNVYRFVVLDDGWGVVDFYEGNITDGKLIATNIGKDTDFPLQGGGKLEFRFTVDIAGDRRLVLIEMTSDSGKLWTPLYRHDYERIK